MSRISRKVRVEGRVQGVGYRASALRHIHGLGGIDGYVRNLPDGAVELVLIGERDRVEAAIEWCGRGPSMAMVSRVKVEEMPESSEYQGFEIR